MSIQRFDGEYRFLSNFWPAEVKLYGKMYPTVEHAYQASKTIIKSERETIRLSSTPSIAKSLGKRITVRKDWNDMRLVRMEDLVRAKFTNHKKLQKQLIDTGQEELIEGNNWYDTFWGVCNGIGQNNLGKILMKVRSEF